nr:hypothetical protein [Tanacetum cinerariifolium]
MYLLGDDDTITFVVDGSRCVKLARSLARQHFVVLAARWVAYPFPPSHTHKSEPEFFGNRNYSICTFVIDHADEKKSVPWRGSIIHVVIAAMVAASTDVGRCVTRSVNAESPHDTPINNNSETVRASQRAHNRCSRSALWGNYRPDTNDVISSVKAERRKSKLAVTSSTFKS